MREIIKLGVILLIIASVSAVILAVANEATIAPIAEAQEQSNNEARQEVLPSAVSFTPLDEKQSNEIIEGNSKVKEIYVGSDKGGNATGYTIKTATSGYGGDIELMTGISVDGKIAGIKVVNHQETPGLGANSTKPEFQNQFNDKTTSTNITVVKSAPKENEINAISGATITSNGVSDGVNVAIDIFNDNLLK